MAKRRKASGSAGDPAPEIAAIRRKLAEGRSQGALRAAKQLLKKAPGGAAEALLADAYEARVRSLAEAGMVEEAEEVLGVARTRFAGDPRWGTLTVRPGDLTDLLVAWREAGSSEERRREIGRQIEERCIDPAVIADAGAAELEAEDPLRLAAGAVQRALREAAAGQLSEPVRAGLAVVGRRSPLAPWRHLALAIASYHAGDDEGVERLLARIPAHAAPARLGQLLLCAVAGVEHVALGRAERLLLDGLTGGRMSIARDVAALWQCDEGASDSEPEHLARIASALLVRDRTLALRFGRWVLREPRFDEAAEDAVLHCLGREGDRLMGLDAGPPFVRFSAWLHWLLPGRRGDSIAVGPVELALVLDRLAPIADATLNLLAEELATAGCGARREDLIKSAQLDQVIRDLAPRDLDDLGPLLEGALRQAQLLDQLDAQVGGPPFPCPTLALRYGERASRLDPSSGRFATLDRDAWSLPAKHRRQILVAWAESLPDDVEPLVRLARWDSNRSAHRKAEAWLERAERLAPLDRRVRGERFRLLLRRLHRHLHQRKAHLCRQDLELLGASPAMSPARQTYLLGARCVVARDAGADDREPQERLRAAVGDADLAALLPTLVEVGAERIDGPIEVPASGTSEQRLGRSISLMRVVDELGLDVEVAASDALEGVSAEALPESLDDLELLCRHFERQGDASWLYCSSGAGLRRDSSVLGRFLLHRAQALRLADLEADVSSLARLARYFAERDHDHTTLGWLQRGFLLAVVEPLEAGEATDLLARERRAPISLVERADWPAPAAGERGALRGSGRRKGPADRGPLLPLEWEDEP